MVIQVIGAFSAVMAYGIIYNVPKKHLIYCGGAGACAWLTYLLVRSATAGGFLPVFSASMIVALFSHIYARLCKAPVTVCLIPGILPLVPGVAMFRIVYYLISGNGGRTSYYFSYSMQAAGAIAIAIFIMDTLFRLFPIRTGKEQACRHAELIQILQKSNVLNHMDNGPAVLLVDNGKKKEPIKVKKCGEEIVVQSGRVLKRTFRVKIRDIKS